MPTILSDPPLAVYAILGVIVLVLGVLAAKRQKKADGLTFLAGLAILLVWLLIDFMVDSPRESVAKTLKEMEAASQARKYDDLFKHVSETFQYKSLDKKGLRDKATLAEQFFPEGVRIWNVNRGNFNQVDETTIEQEFDVQPVGSPQFRYQCVGVFKKESDGQWRMTTFRLYNVVNEGPTRQEVTPPGL
jgi:hypothetical protein